MGMSLGQPSRSFFVGWYIHATITFEIIQSVHGLAEGYGTNRIFSFVNQYAVCISSYILESS